MKIGFIGLGRMGSGLAQNLIRRGYDVLLHDISQHAVERVLQVGGQAARDAKDLARQVDLLFISLPLPTDLEALLLGANGLYPVMAAGATVIDVSTIDPQTARKLADAAGQPGIHYLECPLGKGPQQAQEGTEPIFAGGKQEVFERCLSILEAAGSPVYYLGDVEQSTAFKLISNLIGMTNMAVLAEGIRLAEKARINPEQFQSLLAETGANSHQLHLRGPWILNDDYAQRFSVNLTAKDLRLGVQMARDWGDEAKFSAMALEQYQQAQALGFGDEDTAAVYKTLK